MVGCQDLTSFEAGFLGLACVRVLTVASMTFPVTYPVNLPSTMQEIVATPAIATTAAASLAVKRSFSGVSLSIIGLLSGDTGLIIARVSRARSLTDGRCIIRPNIARV